MKIRAPNLAKKGAVDPFVISTDPAAIKAKRERLELSQRQASEFMGVSPQTWNGWETGRFRMSTTAGRLWAVICSMRKSELIAADVLAWKTSRVPRPQR